MQRTLPIFILFLLFLPISDFISYGNSVLASCDRICMDFFFPTTVAKIGGLFWLLFCLSNRNKRHFFKSSKVLLWWNWFLIISFFTTGADGWEEIFLLVFNYCCCCKGLMGDKGCCKIVLSEFRVTSES